MSRLIGPKCRICRREGVKLFLKGERCFSEKCGLTRKPYPPGLQGVKAARNKISEYGRQLRTTQKIRRAYGITEKALKASYKKSASMDGNHAENLLSIIETRLDNVVFRSGVTTSRTAARQAVGHGHFLLNGRRVDVPSIQVRVGDVVELNPRLKSSSLYGGDSVVEPSATWLKVEGGAQKFEVVDKPSADDVEALGFDPQTVVEYYSR
jgi:small subunit ribosomal protein S4